jgi:hypothetical protein
MTRRPTTDEYAPDYAAYIDLVPGDDVLQVLADQQSTTLGVLRGLAEERFAQRYAPDKWSVAELVGHVIDTEWVMTSRALWFARGAAGPLPSMEQDEFAAMARSGERSPRSLIAEYEHLRSADLVLFRSFDQAALDRRGVASGAEVSVRALLFEIAGHERHHMHVLRERYLGA